MARGRGRKVAVGLAGAAAVTAFNALRRGQNLAGKVVVITGGSRGLGLLLARELAREGARLAICARDPNELERAREDLVGRGADLLVSECDVTDRQAVNQFVQAATARFGRVDILVNNASIIQVGPFENMTLEDFETAMATNFWGGVYATLAVIPQMRARGDGQVVNITSIGGKVAVPHLLPYDCAKFAMVGFSEGLHAEVSRDGICVTTIVPGLMRTGSPIHATFKGRGEKEFAWFTAGELLPLTSMSAKRAALRIVRAIRCRETEVTLGWQAKLLRLAHDLFPGLTIRFLGLTNRLLPAGRQQESRASRGDEFLANTRLLFRGMLMKSARRANQVGG